MLSLGPSRVAHAATAFKLSLDCDTTTAGIQSVCSTPLGSRDVNIVLTNQSGSATSVAVFDLQVLDSNATSLFPPASADPYPKFDSNPDLNQAVVTGYDSCNPAINDTGAGGPGTATSWLSCGSFFPGPTLPDGGSIVLATVHYDALATGVSSLSLQAVKVLKGLGIANEFGSCNPTDVVPMDCFGATVTVTCQSAWNFNTGNCLALNGLWHRELNASISGMKGNMLAFNTGCSGPGTTNCTYNTGLTEAGTATTPAVGPLTGGMLRFKTARDTEPACAGFDLTYVDYSTDGGGVFAPLDLSTGTISAGGQTLGSGPLAGQLCGQSLTAQDVAVPLPAGTTNVRFRFDSVDPFDNAHAGWFIDDVSMAVDADGDGCSDIEELGPTALLGGLRNPDLFWDFFDVTGSKKVDATDIAIVRSKFNLKSTDPGYSTLYDRSSGAAPWAPGPPSNKVDAVDIALVRGEFNHTCVPAP
jgi:hypothetical protein